MPVSRLLKPNELESISLRLFFLIIISILTAWDSHHLTSTCSSLIQSMPTTSRKPKEFLFVDQSISSTSRSRREIELQDAARRAHAARNSRPQRPISSPDGPHSSKPSLSYRSKPHKSKNASSNPPLPAEQQLIVRSKLSGEAQSGATTVAIPRPIDSIIRLGQGHGDPFDTAAIAHLPGFIYDILDYCE